MKRLFLIGLLIAAVAQGAGAAGNLYENDGTVTSPPDVFQIDYTNFLNQGTINLALSGASGVIVDGIAIQNSSLPPFDFSDVVNYTNRGTMTSDLGFRFDTAPPKSGGTFTRHMAANFANTDRGVVSVGSLSSVFFAGIPVLFASPALPQIRIQATNVVSTGVLNSGQDGLISVVGSGVNLSGGTITMEGLDESSAASTGGSCPFKNGTAFSSINPGIFDEYWGIGRGTNIGVSFNVGSPFTPIHTVTFASTGGSGLINIGWSFGVQNAQGFMFTNIVNGDQSNLTVQAVLVGNANRTVSTTARFLSCDTNGFVVPVVQWQAVATNSYTGAVITNSLYLTDYFPGSTNFKTSTNFSLTGSVIPTQSPVNYEFDRQFFFDFVAATIPGNTPYDATKLANGIGVTNSYAGYGVSILPVTAQPNPTIPSQTFSNTAGRVEITASQILDLNGTTLTGPNYLSLTSTNHFAGSAGAQFIVPFTDLNLGSTNGVLAITNLVAPYVPRITGVVEAWSCQWTNVTAGVTNRYHVLMVASSLSPTAPTSVLNLTTRSTNSAAPASPGDVYISDVLNVATNAFVYAKSLTITTNGPGASSPIGELNLDSTAILWSANFSTNFQSLTNFGILSTLNSAFLETRQSPNFPSPTDAPYSNVVNHGEIATAGNLIWADYFENTGLGVVLVSNVTFGSGFSFTSNSIVTTNFAVTNIIGLTAQISSSGGVLSIQSKTAVLRDGLLSAANDMTLNTGTLVFSNNTLQTPGAFNLILTNQLNFTTNGSGRTWTNFINVGDGFNLPIRPAGGDLIGTTVTSVTPGYTVNTTWAGRDAGNTPAGFTNNTAVGHMIFDAQINSGKFRFSPASTSNALYVDLIDLKDFATNRNNPNFPNFIIDPGMKIYFGGARIIGPTNILDISEKLNGANNGAFNWVSNFNDGPFSSVQVLYPSGITYTFNRALRFSSDIDSDGDGLVNGGDSTPFLEPENVLLSVRFTNQPPPLKVIISWTAPANSTNSLYSRTNLTSTNWTLVTNFIRGPLLGTVSVTNNVNTNGALYYRALINPQQ